MTRQSVVSKLAQFLFIFVLLVSLSARAADAGRILKSAVLPGMGQLGDDQTFKGLVLLAGEVTWISLSISQFAQANAFARETEYLDVRYEMAGSYREKIELKEFWEDAHAGSVKSRNLGYAFLGGAVAWWGLNLLDAILLPPRDGKTEAKKDVLDHVDIAFAPKSVELLCNFEF